MSSRAIDRRRFVASGAFGCLAVMTAQELARARSDARSSGKPILTSATLNAAIPSPAAEGYYEILLEAARDPRLFLRSRFTLTQSQEAEIARIRQSDIDALAAYLRAAASQRRPISVAINKTMAATSNGVRECNAANYCVSDGTARPLSLQSGSVRPGLARPSPNATLPPPH